MTTTALDRYTILVDYAGMKGDRNIPGPGGLLDKVHIAMRAGWEPEGRAVCLLPTHPGGQIMWYQTMVRSKTDSYEVTREIVDQASGAEEKFKATNSKSK